MLNKTISRYAFCYSPTAVKAGYNNFFISVSHEENARVLAKKLELLVLYLSQMQVKYFLTSGYRTEALNSLVGGAVGSHHVSGEAFDLAFESKVGLKIAIEFLRKNFSYDELIVYNNKMQLHFGYKVNGEDKTMFYKEKY